MFADVFNLFFIYSKIESKWSILGGSRVHVCARVSVATSKQAYLATEKGTRGEEKKGASFLQIVTEKYR